MIKKILNITLSKDCHQNCGIVNGNTFIADSNDSSNWKTLKFELPSGKWYIWHNPMGTEIELVQYEKD